MRDDQAAEIHLPSGGALYPSGVLRAPRPLPRAQDMPERVALLELASERMSRVLGRHGFRPSARPDGLRGRTVGRRFRRGFRLGWPEVELLAHVGEITTLGLIFRLHFAPVSRLLHRIVRGGALPGDIDQAITAQVPLDQWLPDPQGLVVRESGGLPRARRLPGNPTLARS